MKAFVCFCVLFGATLGYHIQAPLDKKGVVIDTPEVAAEKSAHYLKLAKAGGAIPKDAYFTHEYPIIHPEHDYRYHGPPAPLKHDGTVDETPEVKHVKAERLATLSKAFAKVHHNLHSLHKRSNYEQAPLNHDGTVDETPEVKHIKSARLAALAEGFAKAKKGFGYENEYKKYKGPSAPLKHDGTVDETPEVKHLKYEHLSAVAHAFAKAPQGHDKYEKHEYPELHEETKYKYHGPEAPLKHDGTVDETPEVKHLKYEHLSAVAHAFAKAPQGHDEYEKHEYPVETKYKYHGPEAPLKHDGTVDETSEVKHVKAARLATLSEAFAKAGYHKLNKRSLYYYEPAPLNHDGTVDETPEVKHVKAARLAALSEAFAKAHGYEPKHGYETTKYHESPAHYDHEETKKYNGPPAPLNHDGTVDETPEVKHVKAEHLAAVKEAFAKASHGYDHEYKMKKYYHEGTKKYQGPPAPLNHDGTVAETPEVKHVKSARLSTLSEAYSKAPKDKRHLYKRSVHYDHHYHQEMKKYHGPPAPLNHDGTVDETPEVKHVKAERLSVLKEAFEKAPHGYDMYHHEEENVKKSHGYDDYEETKKYHGYDNYEEPKKYHGPPAPLNHDGTVAETPEVKHVKSARLSTLSEAYAKAPKDEHHIYKRSAHFGYHGPPAPLNHDGTVDETPEVKHLKAEHLATLKEAFAKASEHKNEVSYYKYPVHEEYVETKKYHGPSAPLNHDGTVAETPEVSHVKSERLAALHEAYAKAPQDKEYQQSYPMYIEKPQEKHYVEPAPLNHDGTVAETPEVQARKYEHLATHHKILASLG